MGWVFAYDAQGNEAVFRCDCPAGRSRWQTAVPMWGPRWDKAYALERPKQEEPASTSAPVVTPEPEEVREASLVLTPEDRSFLSEIRRTKEWTNQRLLVLIAHHGRDAIRQAILEAT